MPTSRDRLDDFIRRSNETDRSVRELNKRADDEMKALDEALRNFEQADATRPDGIKRDELGRFA